MDPRIQALLEEREGYVRAGYLDRVPDVDAVLAMLGYPVDVPETTAVEPEPELETTAVEPPPENTAPPKPKRGRPRKT